MTTTYTAQETVDELRQSLAAIVDHPDAFIPLRRQFAEEILAHLEAAAPQANALATIQSTLWRLNGHGPAPATTISTEDGPAANVPPTPVQDYIQANPPHVARETPDPDWQIPLTEEDADLIAQLDAGETTWRKIGLEQRRRLTLLAIANIRKRNDGITCVLFDEQRPGWMSKSNALFRIKKWSEWLTESAELFPVGGDDGDATGSFRHDG